MNAEAGTMRAIVLEHVPRPVPDDGEDRVRVAAAGVHAIAATAHAAIEQRRQHGKVVLVP